jgi:hypothetical protein
MVKSRKKVRKKVRSYLGQSEKISQSVAIGWIDFVYARHGRELMG